VRLCLSDRRKRVSCHTGMSKSREECKRERVDLESPVGALLAAMVAGAHAAHATNKREHTPCTRECTQQFTGRRRQLLAPSRGVRPYLEQPYLGSHQGQLL
jgi:hypothetical protein